LVSLGPLYFDCYTEGLLYQGKIPLKRSLWDLDILTVILNLHYNNDITSRSQCTMYFKYPGTSGSKYSLILYQHTYTEWIGFIYEMMTKAVLLLPDSFVFSLSNLMHNVFQHDGKNMVSPLKITTCISCNSIGLGAIFSRKIALSSPSSCKLSQRYTFFHIRTFLKAVLLSTCPEFKTLTPKHRNWVNIFSSTSQYFVNALCG